MSAGTIRVGIGGWIYERWRGLFYPDGLAPRRELVFAGSKVSAIEINATYDGRQKPASFASWVTSGRDVFAYFIAGAKLRNPAAAQALIARLAR